MIAAQPAPFGTGPIAYLSGTKYPQLFGPAIASPILAADGAVSARCVVEIPIDDHYTSKVDRIPCRMVMVGASDSKLVSDAKKYLTSAMQ